jgi:hypothetical protein
MKKLSGSVLYRNTQGETVEATLVHKTMEHGCLWNDIVYLGEVVEFVGRKSEGELNDITNDQAGDRKLMEILDRVKMDEKDPHKWN